ncbi:MAG: RNA polymerase sigma factor [Saprospiraceae bacterium]
MEGVETIEMADGAKQAIIQTVSDYGKRLFDFIRGKVNTYEDAEDILQEVWYQFSTTLATEPIEQVSGWLFTVARNKITDKYRKQKPELIDDISYVEEESEYHLKDILFTTDADPVTVQVQKLFWEQLFAALDELPENQRQVFVWNELEDTTLQQIADKTSENLKTIISRKRYAVKHLRKRLQYLYNELVN